MIDLHCHVLPGLGDGPDRMDAAVAMVAAIEAEGIDTVVATPTLGAHVPPTLTIELLGRCAELELEAKQDGCAVDIEPGAHLALEWALAASAAELRHASLGGRGRDLLIVVPHGRLAAGFEDGLARLMDAGYRLTLAHPEVNADFLADPDRLARLVGRGVLVQVTARALVRGGGTTPSAALARELVTGGLCHVLATDARSAGPWRAPDLRRGVLEAARVAGARAEWMVEDAPRAILEGARLPAAPHGAATARGLGVLRRRAAA
jgi:protein-tyrosine phosphatase